MARSAPHPIDHVLENETATMVRILERVRREGPISQVELGRKLGVGRAAINVHVKKLLAQGIVIPTGDHDRGAGLGRPRTLLDLAREGKAVLGISLDSPYLSGAIMDFSGRIVVEHQSDVRGVSSHQELAAQLQALVHQLLKYAKAELLEVYSVCFSVPGVLDEETGRIINYVNMPAANGLDVKQVVGGMLKVPVYAVPLAAAIYWGGLEQDQEDHHIFHVVWDLGVGVMFGRGYEVGFKEYRSNPGQVSQDLREIGHAVLWPGGRPCYCGKRGCLEAYLGGHAINDRWNQQRGADPLPFTELLRRAGSGSGPEFKLIARNARRLGEALGWIFSVHRPRQIKLSGQIADAVPIARDAFWDGVCRRLGGEPADMRFSYIGEVRSVALRGTCELALHVRFNKPLLRVVGQDEAPSTSSSTVVVG